MFIFHTIQKKVSQKEYFTVNIIHHFKSICFKLITINCNSILLYNNAESKIASNITNDQTFSIK